MLRGKNVGADLQVRPRRADGLRYPRSNPDRGEPDNIIITLVESLSNDSGNGHSPFDKLRVSGRAISL